MRLNPLSYVALAAALLPTAAFADDPRDPTMRSAAARARDSAEIRRLNRAELERVRIRDARNAQIWRSMQDSGDTKAEYSARSRSHQSAMNGYARDRARYEQEMADWRRAVAACRAGDYAACDD